MQETMQKACQIRELQIEILSERLSQVTNSTEQQQILRAIERVTGVKILH